ncbi:MAG: 4Fe-4S dicluster domain-containing protein [Deltaproteobacteria bacterium]|nr:4Fe-4S dicluster domain-containing protein [Deltaproteobacteria bacterium]
MSSVNDKTYWMAAGEPAAARKEFLSDPRDQPPADGEFSRRDFLKLVGISSVLAGAAACARRPVEKIVPYLNRPEEATPGTPLWYASTADCPCRCGVLVKTREGRPIKLEGNPDHPVNRGGLCTWSQAAVWNLYDPDRLMHPLRHEPNANTFHKITWDEIDERARLVLGPASKVWLLTDASVSGGPATQQLIRDFLASQQSGRHVVYQPINTEAIARGRAAAYGAETGVPHYRFDRADVVVSFAADFLGTWISPVEFAREWASRRRLVDAQQTTMSRLICFEPTLSLTGTNADERHLVRPSSLPAVALALAHEVAVLAHDAGVASLPPSFDRAVEGGRGAPVTTAAHTSMLHIPAAVVQRVARELWAARGKSLLVAGTLDGADGERLQVIINYLNAVLGNEGKTIESQRRSRQAEGSYADLQQLVAAMQAGQVDTLLIAGGNPLYALPAASGFAEAVKQVPVVFHLTDRRDETCAVAHYVLPTSHFLESWGDAEPQTGVYSLVQPTIAPLYQTRSVGEILHRWLPPERQQKDWHTYLRAVWRDTVYAHSGRAVSFDTFWEGALRLGAVVAAAESTPAPQSSFDLESLAAAVRASGLTTASEGFELVCQPSLALYDGRYANNGWLQELPDPVTKITWDNYLSIAPITAATLAVHEADLVRVTVPGAGGSATFELPVHIQPGMHERAVAVALGYGRRAAGRVGNGVGVAVADAAQSADGRLRWTVAGVTLQPTGRQAELACTQGHHRIDATVGGVRFGPRPIVRETTLADYLHHPEAGQFGAAPAIDQGDPGGRAAHDAGEGGGHAAPANHNGDPGGRGHGPEEAQPSMWAPFKYEGYRWAMAVDLSTCTGCSACVVACQVENNIPPVGKKHVLTGREMHWIRIDRYYSGPEDHPETIHQPMMCQHCEKAPCETVCPVLATVHDNEGLNVQVYNRCVGTRYCANNCPYKVRRFNWFDYGNRRRAAYAWPEPLHLMLNPDVTVREKGVMEKCTFCVQRIRSAKEDAKMRDEKVRDGDFQTACQQGCPTGAIVFGNVNDPESRVAQLARGPRGYHALWELNILPQVTYLTKVRNTTVTGG